MKAIRRKRRIEWLKKWEKKGRWKWWKYTDHLSW